MLQMKLELLVRMRVVRWGMGNELGIRAWERKKKEKGGKRGDDTPATTLGRHQCRRRWEGEKLCWCRGIFSVNERELVGVYVYQCQS